MTRSQVRAQEYSCQMPKSFSRMAMRPGSLVPQSRARLATVTVGVGASVEERSSTTSVMFQSPLCPLTGRRNLDRPTMIVYS